MATRHDALTGAEIHVPYAFSYANTSARTGASGFVAGDVGKFARQTDDNSIWMLTATTPTWSQVNGGGSGIGTGLMELVQSVTSGTNGGALTATTWVTRAINTIKTDTASNATLSANQFTLVAGTYRIEVEAATFNCLRHQLRLQNITDSTTTLYGLNSYANPYETAHLNGRFTIAGTKTFEIQHRCEATSSAGQGLANTFGNEEIHLYARFVKE